MAHFLTEKNQVDHETALACIAATPTLERASEVLKDQFGITVSPQKLAVHKRLYPEKYERAREMITPRIEKALADNLLDNATITSEVIKVAAVRTLELLEEGEIADPAKAARDLADVQAKSIDKKLALEGRPQKYTSHLSPEEILNKLRGMDIIDG